MLTQISSMIMSMHDEHIKFMYLFFNIKILILISCEYSIFFLLSIFYKYFIIMVNIFHNYNKIIFFICYLQTTFLFSNMYRLEPPLGKEKGLGFFLLLFSSLDFLQ